MQHLSESFPSCCDLIFGRLLRLFPKSVKHKDGIRQLHEIKNSNRHGFVPYAKLINTRRDAGHRFAQWHPKRKSLLKVAKGFSDHELNG